MYNSDFVSTGPNQWYPQLKDLDPQKCAAVIADIDGYYLNEYPTTTFSDQGLARHVAAWAWRGAARGCTHDVNGSRADLACAVKYRAQSNANEQEDLRFDNRDRGSAVLLDWAIAAYGPVTACPDG